MCIRDSTHTVPSKKSGFYQNNERSSEPFKQGKLLALAKRKQAATFKMGSMTYNPTIATNIQEGRREQDPQAVPTLPGGGSITNQEIRKVLGGHTI